MLFEKITYQDDFPINITIASIEEYPLHYHQDIEFVYVLKGEVTLKNGYCHYTLKEGDIFTNAGHEVHSLTSTGRENIVALIQISTRYFSQYFPSLSKACYRTYSNKPTTKRHDNLREKLLQILLAYEIKSFNYKSECTYLIVDIIKYLDKYFNLFAFENDVVINFESGDQTTTERISRIITYIYQYYAEKITLEDLASMEHLSEFYISHIIKDCTGMNFREFLCFARVEWSEIQLLDTNKKISQIARDVGFSTTAYYEKYFYKWFKRTPEEHRAHFKPMVKSELRPEIITPISANKATYLIKSTLSSLNSQKNSSSVVNSLKLEINVDRSGKPITFIDYKLNIQITPEDFREMKFNLFHILGCLHPSRVTLLFYPTDSSTEVDRLHMMLTAAGFSVVLKQAVTINAQPFISYGNDTIAAPIYVLSQLLRSSDPWLTLQLRDREQDGTLLKGLPSLVTSNAIKKSSFYVYQAASFVHGDIICWGKHYCVIRINDTVPAAFAVIVYNYNDSIQSLCKKDSSLHQVRTVLNEFKDEIDFSFNLNLPPGIYSVMKYTMNRSSDIFTYFSSLNFSDGSDTLSVLHDLIPTSPQLDVYQEDVRTNFHINFSMKGVGVQLALIALKGDSKNDK